MRTLLIVFLTTFALAGCIKWPFVTPTPTPAPSPSPSPQTNQEPSSHKQPAGLDASGRKLGSCVLSDPGAQTWVHENTTFSPSPSAACTGNENIGQQCNGGGCKMSDGTFMICEQSKTPVWDCYAWVYEQDAVQGGTTSKPLAGVTAYVVDFPYDSKPQSSTAVSDQWGYVEVTGGIFNELSFYAPNGYYEGACSFGKPWIQTSVLTEGWKSGNPFPAVPMFEPLPANPCPASARAIELKAGKPHAQIN